MTLRITLAIRGNRNYILHGQGDSRGITLRYHGCVPAECDAPSTRSEFICLGTYARPENKPALYKVLNMAGTCLILLIGINSAAMKAALLIMSALLVCACTKRIAGQLDSTDLQAEASISKTDLSITNSDGVDCFAPTVVLITGPLAGYATTGSDIAPKQTITLPYVEFANAAGKRFDYATTKVSKVTLQCAEYNGKTRRASWKF